MRSWRVGRYAERVKKRARLCGFDADRAGVASLRCAPSSGAVASRRTRAKRSTLVRGWRYAGAQRAATGAGLGALAGAMAGATSISGPPVILFLLAGPDSIATTRANLTFYVATSAAAGVARLWVAGVLDPRAVTIAVVLAPFYFVGALAGSRLFPYLDERRFRQLTLVLMMALSAAIVVT